jgi:hypothetical protein
MSATIRRRELIVALGSAGIWPLAALAQQSERMRRLGVLMSPREDVPRRKHAPICSGTDWENPAGPSAAISTSIIDGLVEMRLAQGPMPQSLFG